jgi:hypothetical protein
MTRPRASSYHLCVLATRPSIMTYNILCDSPFVHVAAEDGDLSVGRLNCKVMTLQLLTPMLPPTERWRQIRRNCLLVLDLEIVHHRNRTTDQRTLQLASTEYNATI